MNRLSFALKYAAPKRRHFYFLSKRMASTITVMPSPSRRPEEWDGKAHHIGSPPTAFRNPWPSCQSHGLLTILKLWFGSHPEKNFVPVPEGPNGTRSDELVRIRKPDWGGGDRERLKATWIGHASFLVEFPAIEGAERGIRVLLDPVFSERTSPFKTLGPKRYTPTPCTLDELPDVDLVCISHDHYDHLDEDTVRHINTRQGGRVRFFAPLGNASWFKQRGLSDNEVTDCDWWDISSITVPGLGDLTSTCCPAQHASGRWINDHGSSLWCSWAFEAGGKKLYFSGDTGYQAVDASSHCPAFEAIGQIIGPFDLALLPIGLMTPQSFMGSVHATPEQSLCIHKEVRSTLSIGMHYGTVRGGISAYYEDVRDPPRRWKAAAEKGGLWCGGGVVGNGGSVDTSKSGVGLCDIGETIAV
jgi:N-acyl-phosphatidylethanolamine-hydrolysing phospholipase D